MDKAIFLLKVIKFYHKIGCTDDEAILAKFEKTLKRKKFIINNDIITLNQWPNLYFLNKVYSIILETIFVQIVL